MRDPPAVGLGPTPSSGALRPTLAAWRPADLVPAVGRAYLPLLLLLTGLYYGSAKLGFALEFTGPVASIVWLPVGVGIGFLYLAGLRYWPAIVAGRPPCPPIPPL